MIEEIALTVVTSDDYENKWIGLTSIGKKKLVLNYTRSSLSDSMLDSVWYPITLIFSSSKIQIGSKGHCISKLALFEKGCFKNKPPSSLVFSLKCRCEISFLYSS